MRFFVYAAILLCAGCSSSSKVSPAGDWKGSLAFESTKLSTNDEAMLRLHSLVNLYISSENRYYYSFGGVLVEGDLTVKENQLTFTPIKVGNMPPDAFEKKRGKDRQRVAGDPGGPSSGELSSDGSSLTIYDATKSTKVVFSRKKTDFNRTGEKTVSGAEAGLVGPYRMGMDEAKASPDEIASARDLLKTSKLKLDQDNTFVMSSTAGAIEGTWSLSGSTLTMKVKRANGSADVPLQVPILLSLKDGELFPEEKEAKSFHFKFVKE